ncbi:MAG: PepSY domain-containing protein [Bacillota bacterium]|uniref:PepSY domain-containing protein n=1 Tax=Desulfurispora thermophila TaxID=265470 RepID=UPI0003627180|nr:PepSY domain-containing protein [Desulfurispora thermophila]
MRNKIIAALTGSLLILGSIAFLSSYSVHKAQAQTNPTSPVTVVEKGQNQTQPEKQEQEDSVTYTSSVQTKQFSDSAENESTAPDREAAESKQLAGLAKITAAQAESSALSAVPGKAQKVALENEDGNVVYSVEVQTAKGISDVKIDAGNGKVLKCEDESADDTGNNQSDANEQGESHDGPDNEQEDAD